MIKKKYLKNPIICIVAMNENRVIGDGNNLLWHLPGDLQRLKRITMGTPLIMGRKTWDSIGRPLPGRASIVLTKSLSWKAEGAIAANSFESAISKADRWIEINKKMGNELIQNKIFLFGGAQIYEIGLKFCDTIEMTKVNYYAISGSKFPKLNENDWKKTKLEYFEATTNTPEFSYWHYNRVIELS